jgi:ribonuclease HII
MLQLRHTEDEEIEVGVDEAGRGCFWGPLYAGAVIWREEMTDEQIAISEKIRDSKKLTEKRRIALSSEIKKHAVGWGVGSVTAAEIEEYGVTKANQLAFTRALRNLNQMPGRILVDGCLSIMDQPWSMIEQVVEPEADGKYISVAAASILAKVARDTYVLDFCKENKEIGDRYGLSTNKGYGTEKHRNAIRTYGQIDQHRPKFLRKTLHLPVLPNPPAPLLLSGSESTTTTSENDDISLATT